jgi:hypothetical protein
MQMQKKILILGVTFVESSKKTLNIITGMYGVKGHSHDHNIYTPNWVGTKTLIPLLFAQIMCFFTPTKQTAYLALHECCVMFCNLGAFQKPQGFKGVCITTLFFFPSLCLFPWMLDPCQVNPNFLIQLVLWLGVTFIPVFF